jgi:hypothetical protein
MNTDQPLLTREAVMAMGDVVVHVCPLSDEYAGWMLVSLLKNVHRTPFWQRSTFRWVQNPVAMPEVLVVMTVGIRCHSMLGSQ